ncbi:MAG: hypothetical protein ACTSV5_07400 [Promethearchaeota archaeon]
MQEKKTVILEDVNALYRVIDLIEEFYEKIPINKRKFNSNRFRKKIKDLHQHFDNDTSENAKSFLKILNQLHAKLQKDIIPELYHIFGGHGGIIINDIGFCEFDSPIFALNSLIYKMELAKAFEMPFNLEVAISCYKWLNINHPNEFAKFKTLYEEGRFEIINPSFSQPYNLIIGEESNIKQFEHGLKILKELGFECNMYYASESSLHPQMPQILKEFGIDFCSLRTRLLGMNPTTPSGHIIWKGLDDTPIQAITDQAGVFNGESWHGRYFIELPHLMFQATSRPFVKHLIFSSIEDFVMSLPYNEEVWRVSKFTNLFGKFVTCSELFRSINFDGEFSFNRDSFYLGDIALTQSELFLNNKKCENLLLTLERLNCVLNYHQKTFRDDLIDELWKKFLTTQAHDNYVVPFIRNGDYSEVQLSSEEYRNLKLNKDKTPISKLSIRIQKEIQKICNDIITEDLQKLASQYQHQNDDSLHFFIFNPASYQMNDIVKIYCPQKLDDDVYLEGEKGEIVRIKQENTNVKFIANVAPLGYKIYTLKRKKNEDNFKDSFFKYKISLSKDNHSIEIKYNQKPFCSIEFNSEFNYELKQGVYRKNFIEESFVINGLINNKNFFIEITQSVESEKLRFKLDTILIKEIIIKPKINIARSYLNYPFGIEETKRKTFQSLDFVWLMGEDQGLIYIQSNAQKFIMDRKTFTIHNRISNGTFEFTLSSTKNDPLAKAYEFTERYFNKLYGVEIKGINPDLKKSDSYLLPSYPFRITNLWSRSSKSYVRITNPSKEKYKLILKGILVKNSIREITLNNNIKRENTSKDFLVNPWKIKTYRLYG